MPLEFPQVIFQRQTEFHMMDSLLKMFSPSFPIDWRALLPLPHLLYAVTQSWTAALLHTDLDLNQHQEERRGKKNSHRLHLKAFVRVSSSGEQTASRWLSGAFVNVRTCIAGDVGGTRLYLATRTALQTLQTALFSPDCVPPSHARGLISAATQSAARRRIDSSSTGRLTCAGKKTKNHE